MEREAFRQRMQQYKQARENNPQLKYWDWKKENDLGYQLYKNNLPSNLQVETDDYDLYGAYESNMQPELNEDGTYHLGSRDPYTGRILKSKQHPTYQKAIESEISAGYFPYEKNNITYTKTYSPVDISGYADGGIIDEDPPQNTSERPITNFDPKGDPYNPTYGYNPGAGYVRSVFDLYDAPVIGDALSIYDAIQALKNKDWLGAGLAVLTVVPFIPTVSNYKKSLKQQLNRITGITPDISKLQKQSDWNDLRNRSIERLYDPEVRARAAKIKSDYNVDLQSTYDKIINQYENDYFSLPEAEIVQLQDAKAMLDLQEEAARRYKEYGIKPTQKDFRIKVDNAVTPNQEITNHEINHFNQYIHQDNPSWNKSELNKITKQFDGKLRDKNLIDPQNTSYFMNWMEQNAYGINMLDRLKELNIKPTKQNILKYLKSLPDTDSIKKAALQFKNLDDYIKWLNTMPLADNGNINETENYNFA